MSRHRPGRYAEQQRAVEPRWVKPDVADRVRLVMRQHASLLTEHERTAFSKILEAFDAKRQAFKGDVDVATGALGRFITTTTGARS